MLHASSGTLVRRGRIVDAPGCQALLTGLARRFRKPLPAGAVVVCCQPVNATTAEQYALRRLMTTVFAPSRLMLLDTVRAAAMDARVPTGPLLVVDIGAQLTEIAVLDRGFVVAARNLDIGTCDVGPAAGPEVLTDVINRNVAILLTEPAVTEVASAATANGMLLAGDGALLSGLPECLSRVLGISVRCAASPRTAALDGAGQAALAALRHPAV
ncbi:rod shape-determining protein [Actinoplanes sp. NPDC024001]|uniref:rod shape-determining protein n=1 Tax=unclassified Actinoplanes TaxID=2626549 RepID=UPI002E1E49ED